MGRPALTLLQTLRDRPGSLGTAVHVEATPSATGAVPSDPLADLAPAGRLVEMSGAPHGASARTTTAVRILAQLQQQGETAVWLQPQGGPLFPPDLADAGVDLDALVVVHIPASAGPHGACKAAELLLRSGAFGLVVVDLCAGAPPGSGEAWQGRLLGLARQHHARVLLLTEKQTHDCSLGPLVGIRIESTRHAAAVPTASLPPRPRSHAYARGRGPTPRHFVVGHAILKNKTGKRLEPAEQDHRGPWGL